MGSKDTAASLQERRAFLLSLLGGGEMLHGGYVREKVEVAMLPRVTVGMLRGLLGERELERFEGFLQEGMVG